MKISTRAGTVYISCHYDDQDRNNKGWYAEFKRYNAKGDLVEHDDTMKIWSVEMPRRADAESLAWRRARGYARRMLAKAARA